MRALILTILTFAISLVSGFDLKEKLASGNPGDYVVTLQSKMYTVLLIREISEMAITLEEISIPAADILDSKMSWKNWIEKKAPGHTSWSSYTIDFKTSTMLESYSYSKETWLYANDPHNFLANLLSLSLKKTPEDRRKRIGPSPNLGEDDYRKLWNPPVVFEGKTLEKAPVSVWTARWPKDGTLISDCDVELYFGDFPFPYWIEIKSPHYSVAIRSIDSGHKLQSPMPLLPKRPPEFLGQAIRTPDKFILSLRCPDNYTKLNLFVIDLTDGSNKPILVPSTSKRVNESLVIEIDEATLEKTLKKGHKYRWFVTPDNSSQIFAESAGPFIFE